MKEKILISKLPTKAPADLDKKTIKKDTERIAKAIGEKVKILNANKKHSLLIVLQGMDSSGKDGVSRSVFSFVSPTMVSAYGFKKPTPDEFAHDFLWRAHKQTPAKGEVKIFVRSHYEDVLIQRVHKWITKTQIDHRFEAINAWEKLLERDNNTTVLKFFLNLSKTRQKEKLLERIEDPEKNFKHNDGDWVERQHWRKYMNAYQDVLNRSEIPWYVVPADSRWYRNYVVANIVLDKLNGFRESYPALEEPPQVELK